MRNDILELLVLGANYAQVYLEGQSSHFFFRPGSVLSDDFKMDYVYDRQKRLDKKKPLPS